MKKCPFCAEEIQDEAIVCRFCGHDLRPEALPQPAPVSSPPLKKCPFCAEMIPIDTRICPHCKHDLTKEVPVLARAAQASSPVAQKRKNLIMGLVGLVAVLFLLFAIQAGNSPRTTSPNAPSAPQVVDDSCDKAFVQQASSEFSALLTQWGDAWKVATSSSRIAMAGPVKDLQAIYRETQQVSVPPCLEKAKKYLTNGMDAAIEGSLAFMAQKSDTVVEQYFADSARNLQKAGEEANRIAACAPNCK